MKGKTIVSLHNGRRKLMKNRIGGDHKSFPKYELTRHDVRQRILNHEVREELLTGDYRHPAARVETTLEPTDLRHTVVSCGRPEDDDTDGSDAHWYIPVDVPKQSGSSSRRRMQSKPPVREFRPAKRQLLPIDDAIRRSA
jgi:hypothetical protein